MTSVGETLRRERLRRNLDLDQISRELKISPKLLEAIEAEEFDKLPGNIFARSFVRQYAHLLGLDEDELTAEVQRTLHPPAETSRAVDPYASSAAPIQVPKVDEWETVGDRRFSWGSPLPALALFVVAMLACSGIYAWYQRTRHAVLAQNTAVGSPAAVVQPPAPAQSQTPTPAPQQPPQAAVPPQPEPSAVQPSAARPAENTVAQPSGTIAAKPVEQAAPLSAAQVPPSAPSAAAAPDPNATVHVQITADEPSWILVRADGKYSFSGTLDANQSRTVDAVKNVELRLGNAGGVNIVLNGKPIGSVGPKGQVRTLQLTSGGFQIVAAPKSPGLIDPL